MKNIIFTFLLSLFSIPSFADIVAGIEIGSKGIKAIAMDYSGVDNNGHQDYKIIFREEIKADVIDGASEGYLLEPKISEAASAVFTLFNKLKKYDPQYFAVVGSTSFDNYKNKSILEDEVFNKTGKRISFITSDEEIYYALKASVRPKYSSRSILIDVGSGNTKIGYVSPMSTNGFESTRFEYGTKSLTQKALKMQGDYLNNLTLLANSEIIPAIRAAIQKQPGISNISRRIYIEGGASWAVASFAQPENIIKPFTYLTLKEISTVNKSFQTNNLRVDAKSEAAESTFVKIMDNFDSKQLQAGGLILETILKEINAEQRKIVFNRNGGWVIGYLLARYNEQRGNLD